VTRRKPEEAEGKGSNQAIVILSLIQNRDHPTTLCDHLGSIVEVRAGFVDSTGLTS
jgi:hypothetical protein